MPEVWAQFRIRGRKGQLEALCLLNSGARVVRLPPEIATQIDPEPIAQGYFRLADGTQRELMVYRVELSYQDLGPVEVRAIILPASYPLISIEAMEKLGITPDVTTGKVLRMR